MESVELTELNASLLVRLQEKADLKTKVWWENYVKGSSPFLGVKMPTIRNAMHQWHHEKIDEKLDAATQMDLALTLFAGEYTEQKLAGTLFLQEILIPAGVVNCEEDLVRLARLFDSGKISDWNVCDWFCVKVLGPLIQLNGMPCAKRISKWRSAQNLWRARASVVGFVRVASESAYYGDVQESCEMLIRRPERFAKTAVGWILRDISKHDESVVHQVLRDNIQVFSPESLKNATKYFSKDEKQRYMRILKNA